MMDLRLQKIAREGDTLSTENHTRINIGPEQEASAGSSNGHNTHYPLAASDLRSCYRVTSDGDGVLHIAASFRNVQLARHIRERHRTLGEALLAAVNNIGDTPLHCAAAGGSEGMVDLFVKEMTERVNRAKFLRAKNLNGETCLHKAVRHGHIGTVKTLISEDKRLYDLSSPTLVQIVDNKGISPLYLATTLRNIEIVKAFVESPDQQEDEYVAAASCAGPEGQTALHAAVVLLDKELIKVLLDWNKGLTQQEDETGSTPLHFLAPLCLERRKLKIIHHIMIRRKWAKDLSVVELILGNDPLSALRADSTGSLPIHVAAAHGRLDIIKDLLKGCPYCDSSRNASGQTFLHVAVEKKETEIVDYVCREKNLARILNSQDQDGNTALHLAVNNSSEKIFCTLIQNKDVCLSFTNKEGRTPLDLAFLRRHPEVISFQGPGERIFLNLLHGGGDFGVSSWDRLTGNVVEPDWEKESERVGKSASMLAVCSVLILNASLTVPFNVISHLDKTGTNTGTFAKAYFPLCVATSTGTFVLSAAATIFCARAGFAMSDGSRRLQNLVTGEFCLRAAAIACAYMVGITLAMVLPKNVRNFPNAALLFGILTIVFRSLVYIKDSLIRLSAVRSRIGMAGILSFQRRAIRPLWAVPIASGYAPCALLLFLGLLVTGLVLTARQL